MAPATSASSTRPSRTHLYVRPAECPLSGIRLPRLPSGGSAPPMRRAVSHGVGCKYFEYPAGGTASVRSTHGAVEYRRRTFCWAAAASFARRGVCRPITAGSWVSPTAPATSTSSARPSRTYQCARTAEYPLEYARTAAPVRRLRPADAPRRAARRGLRVPAVPCRRCRLGAQYSQHSGVQPANPWAGAAASFARRGVCRPITAGSWISPAPAPATSASSARPSRTSRCVRPAGYPLEYPLTAAPVRQLRTGQNRTAWAASTRSTLPAVPPR